eukprot:CAMPEP_0175075254 /NCGR_PEP_ID=MMETSP0052_2-20121109/21877_1 /TAXON_ID=51329 ORGANISM="Polytomella parva, Strain SAG 63-3" /NCGR_SAMPLE_ID=MMETSP0052_2 /ASSEMBLY_ACC=CAM_ASM_000194 /LENGTH=89 /DNA_ID=CAMNT_0016343877 /DNA_START=208 /DNA_END=475 /DNA_ORIENTATION=+
MALVAICNVKSLTFRILPLRLILLFNVDSPLIPSLVPEGAEIAAWIQFRELRLVQGRTHSTRIDDADSITSPTLTTLTTPTTPTTLTTP